MNGTSRIEPPLDPRGSVPGQGLVSQGVLPGESTYHRRVTLVLFATAMLALGVAVVEFGAAAVLGSWDLLLGGVIAALVGAILLLSWRALQRGANTKAAVILTAGLFIGAAAYTFAVPGSIPSLAVLPVIVVVLSMPLLQTRALRWLAGGAWAGGVVLIAVNLALAANAWLPVWFTVAFRVTAFAVVLALALVLLVQHHARLWDSMEATRESATSLAQANHRLQEMDQVRTRFLNTAAHELRTPMTPMIIQLSLLHNNLRKQLDGKQQRSLDLIKRNLDRLNAITEDLLNVSRVQTGNLKLDLDEVRADLMLDEVVDTFRDIAGEHDLSIHLTRPDGATLEGDRKRITQVLYNLVWNAIKFTPPQGQIHVTLRETTPHWEITVRDTGIGIPQDEIHLLFQPFSQLDSGPHGHHTGAGLGLYISRGIIEAHGGEIRVESPGEGHGTTFIVTLPSRSPGRPEACRAPQTGRPPSAPHGSREARSPTDPGRPTPF